MARACAVAGRDRNEPPADVTWSGRARRDAGEAVDSLLTTLDTFHRFWGYVVLVAAVIGVVAAAAGWLGAVPPGQIARRAGLLYIIPLDIQVLVGIVVWLLLGGLGQPRVPARIEHPATMILAAAAAHVGQVLARRARTPKAAARVVTIAIGISLVLAILGVVRLVRGD